MFKFSQSAFLPLFYLSGLGTFSFLSVISRVFNWSIGFTDTFFISFVIGIVTGLVPVFGLISYLDSLFGRLWRYLAVGYANTGLDFLVLNIILGSTGSRSAWLVGFSNLISFCISTLHSYPWMRIWVFRSSVRISHRETVSFVAVTVTGAFVSSSIIAIGTYFLTRFLAATPSLLAIDLIKAVAASAWIAVNFLGYRKFAFRPKSNA